MDGVVLYDGVCGLCNRFVAFVWHRDVRRLFRFAPLQGASARAVLVRHGRDPEALATVVVVVGHGTPAERLLERSAAALYVLRSLGGVWRVFATLLGLVPRALLDRGYDLLARHRYRLFGRLDTCPVPGPEQRGRFLEG